MDSKTILIAPSEALLLGLCVGEFQCYAEERRFPPRKGFLDILRDRLEPHIPPFRKERRLAITPDRLPKDIQWNAEDWGGWGFSSGSKEKFYVELSDSSHVEVTLDWSRLSLFDLLILELGEHIGMSHGDRVMFPPTRRYGELWQRFIEEEVTRSRLTPSPPCEKSSDDISEIETSIGRLIAKNECTHIFEVGRLFGRLVHSIDDFERYVWHIDEERDNYVSDRVVAEMERLEDEVSERQSVEFREWIEQEVKKLGTNPSELTGEERVAWKRRIEEKVQELQDSGEEEIDPDGVIDPTQFAEDFCPAKTAKMGHLVELLIEKDIVRRCARAEGVLKSLLTPLKVPRFDANDVSDLESYHPAQRATIADVAYSRMVIWLAFGELLGVLRDADSEAGIADATSMTPRAFQLFPADSPDMVRNRLILVEQELSSRADVDPQGIVDYLSPAIEGLAKRIWQQDFIAMGRKGDLVSLYYGKIARGTELEQRFAGISLVLLKQYRNPGQHNFEAFRCSVEEARFFVAGMRTLVDLWDRIQRV